MRIKAYGVLIEGVSIYRSLTVKDAATREHVGEINIKGASYDPSFDKSPVLSYDTYDRFLGRGYAPRAVTALTQHIFDEGVSDTIICSVVETNLRSMRVMEKSGYQRLERPAIRGQEKIWNYRAHKGVWQPPAFK